MGSNEGREDTYKHVYKCRRGLHTLSFSDLKPSTWLTWKPTVRRAFPVGDFHPPEPDLTAPLSEPAARVNLAAEY